MKIFLVLVSILIVLSVFISQVNSQRKVPPPPQCTCEALAHQEVFGRTVEQLEYTLSGCKWRVTKIDYIGQPHTDDYVVGRINVEIVNKRVSTYHIEGQKDLTALSVLNNFNLVQGVNLIQLFTQPFSSTTTTFADKNYQLPERGSGWNFDYEGTLASKFMIVCANPLASEAGYDVLKEGGSAIDAVIAAQLVLNLVEPQSSGIGGGGLLMHYNGDKVESFDGRETAPMLADERLFFGPNGKPLSFYQGAVGGNSVGVPGLLKMLKMVHQKYGKLPWKRLFQPAIKIAQEGFPISNRLSILIKHDKYLMKADPETRAYFYNPDGSPKRRGDILKNPVFAETLEKLSMNGGIEDFYSGEIARKIVQKVKSSKNPGPLTLQDMQNYQPLQRDPICMSYKQKYKICGFPPPSTGVSVLQMLKMLDSLPVGIESEPPMMMQVGEFTSYQPTAKAIHLLTEIERLAFADRDKYIADIPDIDWVQLLNSSFIQDRIQLIGNTNTGSTLTPGELYNPERAGKKDYKLGKSLNLPCTSHISVVDSFGNSISFTTSIENQFGSRLMVNGFLLNNQLTDFSFDYKDQFNNLIANRVTPGKRPRSSMSPTLVFEKQPTGKKDKLIMTLGSTGGPIISTTIFKILVATLNWEIPLQETFNMPHFGISNSVTLLEEDHFSEEMIQTLRTQFNHSINVRNMNSGQQGIMLTFDRESNQTYWFGASDPRREGIAMGVIEGSSTTPFPEDCSGWSVKNKSTAYEIMIVCANPLASEAGYEILKEGGSAIDSVIAAQMVLNLVEPQSSGIGGGGFLMHYNGDKVESFDGRETAPMLANESLFFGPDGKPLSFYQGVVGGRSVGVPGVLKMLKMVHQKYGKLSWRRLFQPAIKLARDGFPISDRLASLIESDKYLMKGNEEAKSYFYHPDGSPKKSGEILVNLELSKTFEKLSKKGGINDFYSGEIAKNIVNTVSTYKSNPGLLRLTDMERYKAIQRDPICIDYKEKYKICGIAPPSSALLALQMLKILDLLPSELRIEKELPTIEKVGPYTTYQFTPKALHVMTEIEKLSFADRDKYFADIPDIDWNQLLNSSYINERIKLIHIKSNGSKTPPGKIYCSKKNESKKEYKIGISFEQPCTSHLSVVDPYGNSVSFTTSIENQFGSRLMVNGFLLNNQLTDFSFNYQDEDHHLIANRVRPGKRPRSAMSPTFLFEKQPTGKKDKLIMTLGSTGGPIISTTIFKILVATLNWNISLQDSFNIPHFAPSSTHLVLEKDHFPQSTIEILKNQYNHTLDFKDMNTGQQGIMLAFDQELNQNVWIGATDPRREGIAMGE
eukprot:gene1290-1629_t